MPIHDQGYRRYTGERVPRGRAWAVITVNGIRTALAKRTFLALLLLAWMPFVVRAIQIYASPTLAQVSFLAPTPDTFRQFLDQQLFFVFFVTVYVGGGLIANDRRANALQIYLSKPLTRAEYILGKMAILMALLLFVTWVPGILLLALQIMFAGNFTFFRNNVYLFPAITLYAVLISGVASAAILALSSLSKSARFVGILYAALIFFSQALYGVLRAVTGGSMISWVSLPQDLSQVGNVIFRLPLQYDTPWPVSLLMIVALLVAAGLVLERRVRGVEVVA
jgi:ABC-2 type transport system permease protein